MARYLLGEAGAKWLRTAMSQKAPDAAVGATRHIPSSRGDPDGFLHPFALQYAASAGGEGASGAWIIWVPEGSLVMDGETVDLQGELTAADGYPDGWYDLTDVFGGDDPGDEWSLYLDATKDDPKFVTSELEAENPILIAQVSGKTVKGVVESSLVLDGHGNSKTLTINAYGLWDNGYADPGAHVASSVVINYLSDGSDSTPRTLNILGIKPGPGINIQQRGNFLEISASGEDEEEEEGGAAAGYSKGMFAWTPPGEGQSTGTIGPGGCMVGRRWYTASGTGSGKPINVTYSLRIELTSSGASVSVVTNATVGQAPSGNVSYIPIYTIGNDGKISTDYRGAFVVPAYE